MNPASRQALLANMVQQACAVLLILLPNLLGPVAYAEIVTASVLLSFVGLADLGLLQVYGRMVPELRARNQRRRLFRLEAIMVRVGGALALIFGVMIALMHWVATKHALSASMLAPVPILLYFASAVSTRAASEGDFSAYRKMLVLRSLVALSAIPLAWMFSTIGWFVAQLLTGLVSVFAVRRALFGFCRVLGRRWFVFFRRYLIEGVILAVISALWVQLLASARSLAVIGHPPDVVANYGVMNAVYQAAAVLVIALFMPVSVELNRLQPSGAIAVAAHAARMLKRYSPLVCISAVFFVQVEAFLLPYIFPKFQIDDYSVRIVGSGLLFYPVVATLGGMMVALRRYKDYIAVLLISLVSAGTVSTLILAVGGPAVAQVVGLVFLVCGLLGCLMRAITLDTFMRSGLLRSIVLSLCWAAGAMLLILRSWTVLPNG